MQTKDLLRALCSIMTISGHEYRSRDAVIELAGGLFDDYRMTPNGNFIFVKRSKRPNAPSLLLDAHYDEIGMMVAEIKDGGFLRVSSVGGLKSSILLGGEVTIYANEPLYGVVVVTPPHLQKAGESKKLPEINEIIIDTGYSKEKLAELGVTLGTPVGFPKTPVDLLGDLIADKALDDKACVAAVLKAVEEVGDDCPCDIYASLSCKEEVGGYGGLTAAFGIEPDAAIVLDVDFASVPDTPRHKTIKLGDGPAVTLSAVTDRALTRTIFNSAIKAGVKCQRVVEATGTGTNADDIALGLDGIPTAVVDIPLKNMHTYCEVVSVSDVDETARLLNAFIKDGFTEWLSEPRRVPPFYVKPDEKEKDEKKDDAAQSGKEEKAHG